MTLIIAVNEFEEILSESMESYVAGVKYAIYENDRNATRKTSDSTEGRINDYGFQVLANKNILFIETGRSPGKRPPLSQMVEWIQARGITPDGISTEALAFLIARKIGNDGYEGTPNIISQVTGDLSRIDHLMNRVAEYEVLKISKVFDDVFADAY